MFNRLKRTITISMLRFILFLTRGRFDSKRLIVVGSLIPRMTNSKIDNDTLRDLNRLLGLCQRTEAINVPMSISGELWDSSIVDEIRHLNQEAELSYANEETDKKYSLSYKIHQSIPEWLRYNYEVFFSDLCLLSTALNKKQHS